MLSLGVPDKDIFWELDEISPDRNSQFGRRV